MSRLYRYLPPPLFLLSLLLVGPLPASATGIGNREGTAPAAEEPRSAGGWEQTLGRGLTGTPTQILFPVSFTAGHTYGPRFLFSLDTCTDPQYQECERRTWGPWDAHLDPVTPPGVPAETTVVISLSGDDVVLDPTKYYRVSLALSLFMGGPGEGTFLPRGSVEDVFSNGSTTAAGLADLAFFIEGAAIQGQAPEPPQEQPPTEPRKVSNVLFLPGLKGSRLYQPTAACERIGISCDLRLWLPLADRLVPSLFLDTDGRGDPTIFARPRDLIYGAFGQEFYQGLAERFDAAQRDGTFGAGWQWLPAAYDWRLASNQIARGGRNVGERITYDHPLDDSPGYLITELRSLASSSPTGKVTIVAHSYGGIVAWRMIEALGATASAFVDRLILVGVPQLGAPRALGALLFGDREAIPGFKFLPDPVLSEATARLFARTSPAAYELLPGEDYFNERAATPLLAFGQTLVVERDRYGVAIDSTHELEAYLAARDGGRQDVSRDELSAPAILPEAMVTFIHNRPRREPGAIAVHQLGGWGESTVSGYQLYERSRYVFGAPLGTVRGFTVRFSPDGDGTVPIRSAIDESLVGSKKYWVNLAEARRADRRFGHGNLLESPQVQETIENILRDTTNLPRGVTHEPPPSQSAPDRIRITLGSPARLIATDSEGRRTGEIEDARITEEIPGSWYAPMGTHAVLELDTSKEYDIKAVGTGEGFISLSFEKQRAGEIASLSSIVDIPISPGTIVSFLIRPEADTPGHLSVDSTQDGNPDEGMPWAAGETRPYRPTTRGVPSTTDLRPVVPNLLQTPASRNGYARRAPYGHAPTSSYQLPYMVAAAPTYSPTLRLATSSSVLLVSSTTHSSSTGVPPARTSSGTLIHAQTATTEKHHETLQERWWQSVIRWLANTVNQILRLITGP